MYEFTSKQNQAMSRGEKTVYVLEIYHGANSCVFWLQTAPCI